MMFWSTTEHDSGKQQQQEADQCRHTYGVNPGSFTLTPTKQKLCILGLNPSLEPLSNLSVIPQN